jgi:hypothetical protein
MGKSRANQPGLCFVERKNFGRALGAGTGCRIYGAAVETVRAANKERWTPVFPVSVTVMLTKVCPAKLAGNS